MNKFAPGRFVAQIWRRRHLAVGAPRQRPYFSPLAMIILMSAIPGGCKTPERAYYASPMNANMGEYQPIAPVEDSMRSETFVSGALFTGFSNTQAKDQFDGFHGSVSRAHNLGVIQAWYGLNLNLGIYHIGTWDTTAPNPYGYLSNYANQNPLPPAPYKALNSYAGNKFFGEAGFSGGVNGVWSFKGGEWRVLGLESAVYHEFGEYLRTRQQIPDSITALNVRDETFATLGLTTELIHTIPDGNIGFKWAGGWVLGSRYNYLNIQDLPSGHIGGYNYFNFTFHLTQGRGTFYVQVDGAIKAKDAHLGLVYALGGRRRR